MAQPWVGFLFLWHASLEEVSGLPLIASEVRFKILSWGREAEGKGDYEEKYTLHDASPELREDSCYSRLDIFKRSEKIILVSLGMTKPIWSNDAILDRLPIYNRWETKTPNLHLNPDQFTIESIILVKIDKFGNGFS